VCQFTECVSVLFGTQPDVSTEYYLRNFNTICPIHKGDITVRTVKSMQYNIREYSCKCRMWSEKRLQVCNMYLMEQRKLIIISTYIT